MKLTAAQRAMLEGGAGPTAQRMMQLLHRVGQAMHAQDFIPIRSAHVGLSYSSLGPAGVHWLERLAANGAQVCVPTTTNVLSAERRQDTNVDNRNIEMQERALSALVCMGADANCSCNPFSQGYVPRFGESLAWSESACAPYVNGVLGARTNREGVTALASALTGVTPNYGMHLVSERRARLVVRVKAELADLHHFHLLGAWVARQCAENIPAIVGLRPETAFENLYGLCAAFSTYSPLAILHMVGISPEAPTVDAALNVGRPYAHAKSPPIIDVTAADLEQQRQITNQCKEAATGDIVIIGCPHATLNQLQEIFTLMKGKSISPNKAFFIHTNSLIRAEASRMGVWHGLIKAGITVTSDTCIYVSIYQHPRSARVLTNSAKMAHLMSSRGFRAALASTADCVLAATK
ncbi:DUF521 domain-containing protein [Allopusillimonas soli]|uniref:Aconitase X catalytic domain-containing protein n=1 Tax=Allopusillimonas soli TaxID=659016 RepID=A0A853F801_9BURK|nr:aconitase X catalytic domain-containing protein [Allopusillimonas soli]NYT36099.1 aconitase X catalytic domain-containing protein [Allopusillimonas soli]TEA76435.1 DUF521 domain-containing protein [Allopusillimonas soli]